MTAHSLTQMASMNRRTARTDQRTGLGAIAAEGMGWAAYGLFYVAVLAALLGFPIWLGYYLVGL
jgi:hypothetical protein